MENFINELIQAQRQMVRTQEGALQMNRHLQDQLLIQGAMLQAVMETHPDQAALAEAVQRIRQSDPAVQQALQRSKSLPTQPSGE